MGSILHVKDTAEIGKVYQSVNDLRVYTKENVLNANVSRLNSESSYPTPTKNYEFPVYKDSL
ncbi:hypothetical protein MGH68_01940 [Erysipelothrix sp. D19-032]